MIYLKTYESYNSIDSTKKWTKEVMLTCKDIMIELEDAGMKTSVKKSVNLKEKSILIECFLSYGDCIRWYSKFPINEICERLQYYMESEGFELNRANFNSGISRIYYDYDTQMYQLKISFKKSGLDSDYIGHIRYLNRYNISESKLNSDDYLRDIEDICLELNDEGLITTKLNITNSKYKNYFTFSLTDHMDFDGFLFNDISEYVFRIKDFLGDRYKGSLFYSASDIDAQNFEGVNINLDNKKELDELEQKKINMFVILL